MGSSFIFLTSMVLLIGVAVGLLLYSSATAALPVLALVVLILSLVVANGGAIP